MSHTNRTAFTRVELLVVLAIVGVLLGVGVPAILSMREMARQEHCMNNLKQLGLSLHNYHDAQLAYSAGAYTAIDATDEFEGFEWRATGFINLMPYIDANPFFNRYNFSIGPGGVDIPNGGGGMSQVGIKKSIPVFNCPDDPLAAAGLKLEPLNGHSDAADVADSPVSSYCFNSGRRWGDGDDDYFARSLASRAPKKVGPFSVNSSTTIRDVTDGLSNVIAIAEAALNDRRSPTTGSLVVSPEGRSGRTAPMWLEGDFHTMRSVEFPPSKSLHACMKRHGNSEVECRYVFGSQHAGGLNVLFLDGAVRFMGENVDVDLWNNIGTMAGGEPDWGWCW